MVRMLFLLLLVGSASWAQTTAYVDTDCANNGDGTTASCAGAPAGVGAYNSLANAITGEATDLVTATTALTIQVSGTSADTTQVDVNGFTTSATYDLTIKTDEADRHPGTYSTSHYRLEANTDALTISDDFVTIDGLQIYSAGRDSNFTSAISVDSSVSTSGTIVIKNNIIRGDATGSAYGSSYISGIGSGSGVRHEIFNNIVYDFETDLYPARCTCINLENNPFPGDAFVYHNTLHNCGKGIEGGGGSNVIVKNNLVQGSTSASFNTSGTFEATSDYNISEDANAVGTNAVLSTAITFTNEGSDDFHTSDINAQVSNNLYADADIAVVDDIDGDTRPSSGDVYAGADENIAASGGIELYLLIHEGY